MKSQLLIDCDSLNDSSVICRHPFSTGFSRIHCFSIFFIFYFLFFYFFFFFFLLLLLFFQILQKFWVKLDITKTCLYNFDPLKPHFYIIKLGFTRVYIIFRISAQKHKLWYSLEPPRRGGSNEYPQSML